METQHQQQAKATCLSAEAAAKAKEERSLGMSGEALVGELPKGWEYTTLGDFIRLKRGHDLTEADRRPGQVPNMGSAGHNGFHDRAKATGPGVVIGRSGVGSMGVVTYCATDYWPHNTVLYVTDFLGNDERFTYYFLHHLNLRRFDSGSAQASLNRNYIYPIQIRVPPLPEQRAIAHILATLDELKKSLLHQAFTGNL